MGVLYYTQDVARHSEYVPRNSSYPQYMYNIMDRLLFLDLEVRLDEPDTAKMLWSFTEYVVICGYDFTLREKKNPEQTGRLLCQRHTQHILMRSIYKWGVTGRRIQIKLCLVINWRRSGSIHNFNAGIYSGIMTVSVLRHLHWYSICTALHLLEQ